MNGISKAMVRIEGTAPLLMHNSQLVDPGNEWVKKIKEITGKHHSKKTEADDLKLQELEFNGGLYFDNEIGPYIPDICIEGSIRDAAKTMRKGPAVLSGMSVEQSVVPLEYDGPRTRDGLFDNKQFVDKRVVKLKGSSSLLRTRPRFNKWALEFEVMSIDEVLSIGDVASFIEIAGKVKGLCDFRPKFGRYVMIDFVEV